MTSKWISLLLFLSALCSAQELAQERVIGQLEVVATFDGAMPTGVTVANSGRIFVNFPRWGDKVEYTVAEVKGGKTVPYPSADINRYAEGDNPVEKLVSVQSVVVDPTGNRLWILDTGSTAFGPVLPGGAKLLAVDLSSNQIVKKIVFPADVALYTSYMNDVRFDMHRGTEGTAFITDSSTPGTDKVTVHRVGDGFDVQDNSGDVITSTATEAGYRLVCSSLPRKFTIRIVFALIDIDPRLLAAVTTPIPQKKDKWGFVSAEVATKDFFSLLDKRPWPSKVSINGDYTWKTKTKSISKTVKVENGN